jgi:hypothetical protein
MVLCRRTQPNTGTVVQPQPSSFWLSGRHFKPFFAPQSFDPFVINLPPLNPQHGCDTPVSIAAVLSRQFNHLRNQSGFISPNMRFSSLGAAGLAEQIAGSAFGCLG